jgi:hypothetical protein
VVRRPPDAGGEPWSSSLVIASLAALVLLWSSCLVENPSVVRDSTGAELGWDCASGSCTTVRESYSPLPPECGEGTELLVGAGPIALLCAVSLAPDGSDRVHETTCRPLACADALDCPQWNAREYTCIGSLCQVANAGGWRLDHVDLAALCLYDLARHASCEEADADPVVRERMLAVDAACASGTCESIPDGCLDP